MLPEAISPSTPLRDALGLLGIPEQVVYSWVRRNLYREVNVFDGSWEHDEYHAPHYPELYIERLRHDRVRPFSLPSWASAEDIEATEVLLNTQVGGWPSWLPHTDKTLPKQAFLHDEEGPPLELAGLQTVGDAKVAKAISISGQRVLEAPAVFFYAGEPVWIGTPAALLEHSRALSDLWCYAEFMVDDTWYEWIGESREFEPDLIERSLAGRYGLLEFVNLRNWLARTRNELHSWNGPPKAVVGIFAYCLSISAWLAQLRLRASQN